MQLPLEGIDFGAHGGTNFSKLELHRASAMQHQVFDAIAQWGHTAAEMVESYNELNEDLGALNRCPNIIVSGGVKQFTDGYYLTERIAANAVYGQASAFLQHARGTYTEYVDLQVTGLTLANTYLKIR